MSGDNASAARRARAAAQRYWDDCRDILRDTGGSTDDDAIGFVAGSSLLKIMADSAQEGTGLVGLWRGIAGMAKVEGASKAFLIGGFRRVVSGVFASPRLNQ